MSRAILLWEKSHGTIYPKTLIGYQAHTILDPHENHCSGTLNDSLPSEAFNMGAYRDL